MRLLWHSLVILGLISQISAQTAFNSTPPSSLASTASGNVSSTDTWSLIDSSTILPTTVMSSASPAFTAETSAGATASTNSSESIRDWNLDFYDPRSGNGSWLDAVVDTYPPGLGEPLNVVISARSDSAALSQKGFEDWLQSIGYSYQCFGIHMGNLQSADLGDGRGFVNQSGLYRWDYGWANFGGTCIESLDGGSHVRYWFQQTTGAIFLAVSDEHNSTLNHGIIENGYDLGRDHLVGNATREGGTTSPSTGLVYGAKFELASGFLKNGSEGINHNLPIDGGVAVVIIYMIDNSTNNTVLTAEAVPFLLCYLIVSIGSGILAALWLHPSRDYSNLPALGTSTVGERRHKSMLLALAQLRREARDEKTEDGSVSHIGQEYEMESLLPLSRTTPSTILPAAPLLLSPEENLFVPPLVLMSHLMFRYDTVTVPDKIWHGFALVVVSDIGSKTSQVPVLRYWWTVGKDFPEKFSSEGLKIYSFGGSSFWRFKVEIQLNDEETEIQYSLNDAGQGSFFVPAKDQDMRWLGYSCNGFTQTANQILLNGADPMWADVNRQHAQAPIHVLVGAGDQLYCDTVMNEPLLRAWAEDKNQKLKISMPASREIIETIDFFYFNHYLKIFGQGEFGKALRRIPMVNMIDDHDIIDGWGSYPDELQRCPIFSAIGARAFFWSNLFQHFINSAIDGWSTETHPYQSIIFGGPSTYVPGRHTSFGAVYLGPRARLMLLDTRSERTVSRVIGSASYEQIFNTMYKIPDEVQHVIILLGVPIVYPHLSYLERGLDTGHWNPMKWFKKGLNEFNAQPEILDDLNDEWTSVGHRKEREWLIAQCQQFARERHKRISFFSGDVHLCCASSLQLLAPMPRLTDPKYMLQVVSSAIVNESPPKAVVKMINELAAKKVNKRLEKSLATSEIMLPVFNRDTEGQLNSHPFAMARRNFCLGSIDPISNEIIFELRVELQSGLGQTKGYEIRSPRLGIP